MSDVEHLFMCLLATCMSSLEKFNSLAHFGCLANFLIGSFIFCRLLGNSHSDQRERVPQGRLDLHFSDYE